VSISSTKIEEMKNVVFNILLESTDYILKNITDDNVFKIEIVRHFFEMCLLSNASIGIINGKENESMQETMIESCNYIHQRLSVKKPKTCKQLFSALAEKMVS
jgi:hypothetical protein